MYLRLAQHNLGPLFQDVHGQAITTSNFRPCVMACHLDSNLFTGHFFRIGAASYAYSMGKPTEYIKQIVRWKSPANFKYIRPSA